MSFSSIVPFILLVLVSGAIPQDLPTIKLPYGTWRASKYNETTDIYTFKNIRFAAPPVESLRWAKPALPATETVVQNGTYGPICIQGDIAALLGDAVVPVDIEGDSSGSSEQNEDCLFLDVYVPGKALKGEVKLPIVNWIYGGGYIVGSKEAPYDGTGVVKASGGNVIYVGANYRLGAFGFLAGPTIEEEATPNAALWDQKAVFDWIRSYGSLFGGDIDNLSVWGESAGAGSIVHHLTAFGGKKGDASFKRAVIQSPAFSPQIGRNTLLADQYMEFEDYAGCKGKGLSCLRTVDTETLRAAQDKYGKSVPVGNPGWGPAADGNLVRQHAIIELASGNVVKGIDSIVNSHVADEAEIFVPRTADQTTIDAALEYYFGASNTTIEAINAQYSSIADHKAKLKQIYQFLTFTCHNRYLSEAYTGKSYNLQYGRGSGLHGTDIDADFYDPDVSSFSTITDSGFKTFAPQFQAYLLSHARTGDPNKLRDLSTITWPLVTIGQTLSNVLNATDQGFVLIEDPVTKQKDCNFWKKTLARMTSELGWSSP